MIIDSSAILAILFGEEDMKIYEAAIAVATVRRLSAGNYLETSIVVESRAGNRGLEQLDALLERATIEVVPVTVDQVRAARRAWREFGKGNHPAGLNFGDCFAYALALTTGETLLFKGDDFTHTDILAAV